MRKRGFRHESASSSSSSSRRSKRSRQSSSSSRKSKRSRHEKTPKWSESQNQFILIVGDGDFSFSCSLARALKSGSNITATSYDSHGALLEKYKNANENLEILQGLGAQVMHDVDATKMQALPCFDNMKFDVIFFNFPHSGFVKGGGRVSRPKAIEMLTQHGHIQVTHKSDGSYGKLNIVGLAQQEGLIEVVDSEWFNIHDYHGYENKYGDGKEPNEPFALGKCKKYKFGRKQ
ncbi:hypothetical protein L1987_35276 [Smallanthus sonchifolius]|uniref:Uncharacterized protein n=1 Tax=Smallanthus sonchifolius TaxID=185202 RepID=A0ACB9HXX3_9ASTR|nr:hypothetical protein L1987_35276 [Smallanthus sonchifolius]